MGFFSLFLSPFRSLEDLRQTSKVTHPLPEILLVTLFGVVCGCDGWADIERYGKAKLPLLREFLPYANGIPGEARLVLAQAATEEKLNEITAIPQLLDVKGATVSIGRDGLPADDVAFLREIAPWTELKSVARVTATCVKGRKSAAETRHSLSSVPPDAARIAHAVRGHWGVENSLHGVPDVTFGEDESRIKKGNSPFLMAIIRHVAVNLIQAVKKKRDSVAGIRKSAGRDDVVLRKIFQ